MTIAPYSIELTEEQKKLAEWWTKNVFQRPMPKKKRRRRKHQTQDSKKQDKDLEE